MSKDKVNESVEDLVSAILDGDQEQAKEAFQVAMAEKLQSRFDDMKRDIAQTI